MRWEVWALPGPCSGAGLEEPEAGEIFVRETPEAASEGGISFLLHFRRAVPPPPPPSATGTVGADVPPASGRGSLGGQWGPGLEMGQKARRIMFPWGDCCCHHCRQLACPPSFPSLVSTGAGGSQDVGAVSPQTTMTLRACCEDRRWPRDPR